VVGLLYVDRMLWIDGMLRAWLGCRGVTGGGMDIYI
jgi:hypothetical protein